MQRQGLLLVITHSTQRHGACLNFAQSWTEKTTDKALTWNLFLVELMLMGHRVARVAAPSLSPIQDHNYASPAATVNRLHPL
jgi:hypothetical protein